MNERNFGAFAPVTKAERERALDPSAAPAAEAPASAVQTPAAPPVAAAPTVAVPAAPVAVPGPSEARAVPRFVGGRLRYMEVPIDSPIEHDGVLWEAIPLRRPSAVEVGRYFERLVQSATKSDLLRFPIYAREDGTPVPDEVLDFLDLDDQEALAAAAEDFLPDQLRRFRDRLQLVLRSPDGGNTEPTSSNS